VEAALAILSLVAVLALCLAGLSAMSVQVRCIDAAREAARLAARGDHGNAVATAHRVAPEGASVSVRTEGDLVVATVSATSPLLFGLRLGASGVSAMEPGG
jgi:hypothetical protein